VSPAESIRQRIAEHPEVVEKFRAFADAAVAAGVNIGGDALLALLPAPAAGLAGLVAGKLERALIAALQHIIDASLATLVQAHSTTTPGSGVAGLTEISETITPSVPALGNEQERAQ
jgi:hypothetical protein